MSRSFERVHSKINRVILLTFLGAALFHFSATSLSAQQMKSRVTVVLEQLPINLREDMADLNQVIQDYIDNYDWVEDDQGGQLRISMQFLLTDASVTGETRFKANLVVTNEKEIQYLDKRCHFSYQRNEQLVHDLNQIGPLTALIDYYVYLILGNEYDKLSRFGGDVYFKLAQEVAGQGRFQLATFKDGWEQRTEDIREILSNDYRDYRLMKDVFFYGIYLFDDTGNVPRGRKYVAEAVKMMERGIRKQPKIKKEYEMFIQAYSGAIIQTFNEAENTREVFETMVRLDPDHKDSYEPFLR